jgi:hypothetical protein
LRASGHCTGMPQTKVLLSTDPSDVSSVAELFAARVERPGRCSPSTSTPGFVEPLAAGPLHVRRSDFTAEAPRAGQFDLVHARLRLEHLLQRAAVLPRPGGRRAARWLAARPGPRWATATVLDPPSDRHDTIVDASAALFAKHTHDPRFGRRLPRALAGTVDS